LPCLIGAFSLGYGEKHPYWQKFLVGWAWIIPKWLFITRFDPLGIIIPFIWIGLFKLSNTPETSSIFKWHTVELIVGGMLGAYYTN